MVGYVHGGREMTHATFTDLVTLGLQFSSFVLGVFVFWAVIGIAAYGIYRLLNKWRKK